MADNEPKGSLKQGRLSNKDIAFIKANAAGLPVTEIAARLRRTVESVEEAIKVHCKGGSAAEIQKELLSSETWAMLKEEFTPDELRYFKEQFLVIKGQFRGEILATEETSIVDVIKLQILQHRNLVLRRQCVEDTKRLEREIEETLREFGGDYQERTEQQASRMMSAQEQINLVREKEKEFSLEYNRTQGACVQILKSLKATRDQRLKQSDSLLDVNWLGIIKEMQKKETQDQEGRFLELMKLSAENERTRLGSLHTFMDGVPDRPLLNCDTIDQDQDSNE